MQLLHPPLKKCISWVDPFQGIFKIIDPIGFAKVWAQQKNRQTMKYENLARSLRSYTANGILQRQNEKFTFNHLLSLYRFNFI
ncbi:hypothetical protein HZS_2441 [Henneguya salminicola]|nr:hypothetical protein HZS_2441 [Henneguya salminicola]